MIDWIQSNYEAVFAILGALYTLARLVVALTPTPADNAAVETAAGWLKTIAKLFGLDITQGIDKKG